MTPNDSKSYTGYVFTLGGAAISWKSRKQRTVALSTTEAEYQARTEATKESRYLRGLVYELGIPQFSEGLVYCDNQGAINLTTAAKFYDRTKHVRIKFNFVREAVQNKTIKLLHQSSENMVADILTKSLARERDILSSPKHWECVRRSNSASVFALRESVGDSNAYTHRTHTHIHPSIHRASTARRYSYIY